MSDPASAMQPQTAPITELVDQFLEMASSPDVEPPGSDSRQAGLMYELDTLVSDYLDQNQLSSDEFHHLEQQVLNTIAEDLINESETLNEKLKQVAAAEGGGYLFKLAAEGRHS